MAVKKPEGMVELNGYIEKDLKRKFKTQCTYLDRTMGEVLSELIKEWLQKQKKD